MPLLVDADTGFGTSAFNIARTVKELIKVGTATMHIEDQTGAKRRTEGIPLLAEKVKTNLAHQFFDSCQDEILALTSNR